MRSDQDFIVRRRKDLNPRTPYGISTLAGPLFPNQGRLCAPEAPETLFTRHHLFRGPRRGFDLASIPPPRRGRGIGLAGDVTHSPS
jgi:hypothetical protein